MAILDEIGIEDRLEMLISSDLSTFLWSAGDGRGWTRASMIFDMALHTPAEAPNHLTIRQAKKRDRGKSGFTRRVNGRKDEGGDRTKTKIGRQFGVI